MGKYTRERGVETRVDIEKKLFNAEITTKSLVTSIATTLEANYKTAAWQNGIKLRARILTIKTNRICGFDDFESVWFEVYLTEKNGSFICILRSRHKAHSFLTNGIKVKPEQIDNEFKDFVKAVKSIINLQKS